MKTSRDEYPYWSVSIDVPLAAVTDTIKYKYMVMKDNSQRWEDAIADRTLEAERRAGGVLAPGMHTYVDDGQFNHGGRVCTYVRDTHERGRVGKSGSSTQLVVPAGMQLVSQEQVRQWEVRVAELEEDLVHDYELTAAWLMSQLPPAALYAPGQSIIINVFERTP